MQLLNSRARIWAAFSVCLSTGAIVLSTATPVRALSLQNTSGIASPAQTVTFDEFSFAEGTAITNQFSSLGVTFSPSLRYYTTPFGFPNISPAQLGNFSESGPEAPTFSILFNTNQTAAAFAMATNPGTSTFTALLNGVVVESFSAATGVSLPNNFYGFTGITFNEILIAAGGGGGSASIDNIQLNHYALKVHRFLQG